MRSDFVTFILSHGRPNNVVTYTTLKKCGYTGNIIVVVDNEDSEVAEYKRNFPNVVVFDKLKKSKEFDTADLSEDRRAIVYARNACFDIAKEFGYKYFLELDDDYLSFEYRYKRGNKLKSQKIKNIDTVFNAFITFLANTPAKSIAFSQGGDFIGGVQNPNYEKGLMRKCMNSFFCSVDKPFNFLGRVNEDVNTYTCLAQKGDLFFSYTKAMLNQKQTQSNAGGMTSLYLDSGTYVKSFYSIIFSPSCVKISLMGDKHKRIHHKVNWDCCCPMILNERYKK